MKTQQHANYPVAAFALVVFIGWAAALYLKEWWWLAIALVIGLVAGDFVQAVVEDNAQTTSKPKGHHRDR